MMKRLLKISLDISLFSFIPVVSWFLLGIIIDNKLINIFTITYPLQFVYYIIKCIFSVGANISKEKDKNKNAVMSGIVTGIIVAALSFGFVLWKVEDYISFMNMDVLVYKTFTIYTIILLFFQVVFSFILDKLYYEEKNSLANKYSIIFNAINFVILILTSLITKNQMVIVTTTIVPVAIFTIYILIKSSNKFKYNLNIKNCIKYDSVELISNIFYLLIFLFGLSTAFEYGPKYAAALTFVSLITDTQWDTTDAIVTAAQIDISKGSYNYKESRNNAYKLLIILFLTTIIMYFCLFGFYNLDIKITMIYLSVEFITFLIYPLYRLKICYLQLEWSAVKATTNKILALIIRFVCSFIKSPFCTGIGQVISAIYQFVTYQLIFRKKYYVNKSGTIIKRLNK